MKIGDYVYPKYYKDYPEALIVIKECPEEEIVTVKTVDGLEAFLPKGALIKMELL